MEEMHWVSSRGGAGLTTRPQPSHAYQPGSSEIFFFKGKCYRADLEG